MSASEALSVYRLLLRTSFRTFKGDEFAKQGAVSEIRKRFEESRAVFGPDREQRLAEGRDAAAFLESFVVQGVLNERGNYTVKVSSPEPGKENIQLVPEPGAILEEQNKPQGGGCGSGGCA